MPATPTRRFRIVGSAEEPAPRPVRLLTAKEAAGRLNIGESTLYRLAQDGRIPGIVRIPGTRLVRFSSAAIDDFIARSAS